MRSLSVTFVLVTLIAFSTFAQSAAASITGNWLGTLEIKDVKIRLVLKVAKAGDGLTAKFDSPDQDARDLPIDRISFEGGKVTFAAAQYGISYEGTLSGDQIEGTFKQFTASFPLTFKRTGEILPPERRQNPSKPYAYDEEEVSYRNVTDNVKLAGTLTLPKDKSKRYPAVILITGSGSQDRDETIAGHKPFLVLADHLTKNGIAVLRVDDRGIGGSDRGDVNVTSENFMYDVLAGVEYLKTRKEIDPKQIGLIGHSEGGMIAPMAAATSKDVAFIVMMAGLGQRGDELIYTQTEMIQRVSGTDAETIASSIDLFKKIDAIVRKETDKKRIEEQVNAVIAQHVGAMNEAKRKAFAPVEASAKNLMSMYSSPWYRYFITYDPAETLKKVTVPVLALNGERDLQVSYKQNLDGIAAGLKLAKNRDVTVRSFPHLNHLFQSSMTGLPSEYQTIEETMSPDVMWTISDWILAKTAARR